MNNRGMTLISTMIAASIAATIIFYLSESIIGIKKGEKRLRDYADYNQFVALIDDTFANDEFCDQAFAGQVFPTAFGSTTIPATIMIGGVNYSVGTHVNNNPGMGYRIGRWVLEHDSPSGMTEVYIEEPPGSGNMVPKDRARFKLHMQIEKPDGTGGWADYRLEQFYVMASLDSGTGDFAACHGEFSAAQACIESGGTYNPTAPNPEDRCDILGDCVHRGGFTQRVNTGGGKGYDGTYCDPGSGNIVVGGAEACACPLGSTAVPVKVTSSSGGGSKLQTFTRYRCEQCN